MQIQTKKTLRALMVCLPIVICYFLPVKPNVFTYPLIIYRQHVRPTGKAYSYPANNQR
jgi:hypothetical protein